MLVFPKRNAGVGVLVQREAPTQMDLPSGGM